ncbi:DUF397 domain-containing protein [Nocardia sp. NPDC050412]|uniref:DUF397 domain-containing protein n=1 Tax=Nocardia sp. NPDC050412 TaxID=3364320 RepID=UPI00378C6516
MTNHSDPKWFKSSHSGAHSNCAEVASLPNNHVGVRNSKQPSGPALVFTPAEWSPSPPRLPWRVHSLTAYRSRREPVVCAEASSCLLSDGHEHLDIR